MMVPLLSTGIVGYANGAKMIGPGHGSFIQTNFGLEDMLWIIYHASAGENCNRLPFVDFVDFVGWDGWPVVDFLPH